jgi:glycine/D-amino acid oxidase-like deaminating enzyme
LTEAAEKVRRRAALLVPGLADAPIADARVGHRAIPGDGFPMIGSVPDVPGYYEAVTHSGITLAPVVARTLTTEIVDGRIDPLVAPFRASRQVSG